VQERHRERADGDRPVGRARAAALVACFRQSLAS
jgi:hypothetical protein